MQHIEIAGRRIGPGQPCFIIGEAGVNHNGSLEMALQLVDVAVAAGVDAVKFQTFRPERVISANARKAKYQMATTGGEQSQLEMARGFELPYSGQRKVFDYCRERGILFLSTPFDHESADFLEELGVPAFKIPSGEITNYPFLEHLAHKRKPIILSTGMARIGEVDTALQLINDHGVREIALLHCVSSYPTQASDANLRAMDTMRHAFGLPIGYSDHTMGLEVPFAAVALGACVIEKHFTVNRALPGPDQAASAEPEELKQLVKGIRNVEAALGHGRKEPAACEHDTAEVARRSLLAAVDIPKGTPLTADVVSILRPGTGLPPAMLPHLLGRVTRRAIPLGEMLTLEAFE